MYIFIPLKTDKIQGFPMRHPFFILLFLFSCHHTFKAYDKESFPHYIWLPQHGVTFRPVIKAPKKEYILTLGIRHLYGFEPRRLDIRLTMISPSGVETLNQYSVIIKDFDNAYLGSCAGDYCDLETVVSKNLVLEEEGIYTFSFYLDPAHTAVAGVMEWGMILDEVKKN